MSSVGCERHKSRRVQYHLRDPQIWETRCIQPPNSSGNSNTAMRNGGRCLQHVCSQPAEVGHCVVVCVLSAGRRCPACRAAAGRAVPKTPQEQPHLRAAADEGVRKTHPVARLVHAVVAQVVPAECAARQGIGVHQHAVEGIVSGAITPRVGGRSVDRSCSSRSNQHAQNT